MSLIKDTSVTNFWVGIQPMVYINQPIKPPIPINASEEQTIFKGRGYKMEYAIGISKKQEWFMSIKQGSFLPIFSSPSVLYVKPEPPREKIESNRISVRQNKLGFTGFLRLGRGLAIAFSKSRVLNVFFKPALPFLSVFFPPTVYPMEAFLVNKIRKITKNSQELPLGSFDCRTKISCSS